MNSIYFQQFAALAVVHFLAVVAPGPDFALTVQQSLRWGRRIGVASAIGIGSGISLHVAYTLLGVGVLMNIYPWTQKAIAVMGATYLLYLAWPLLVSKKSSNSLSVEDEKLDRIHGCRPPTWMQAFSKGFLTNALNPKATLFFMAIFTTIVSIATPLSVQILYGAWMCAVNAIWFTLVAIMFTFPGGRIRFSRIGLLLERGMGAIFAVFSIRLLLGVWG